MAKQKEKAKVIEQQVRSYTYTRKVTLEEKVCPTCGKTFEGVKIRKFCSRACQNKADYNRHGDDYRHARMERYNAEKSTATRK